MRVKLFKIVGLIALGVISRLIPHPPNMTAIGAIALKSREHFGIFGLVIPLTSMVLADAIIGFYDWKLLLSVYASFALFGMLGVILKTSRSIGTITGTAAIGSTLFFVITNTVVWALSSWYPHTAQGLLMCYMAGLPFFYPMLAGDVVSSLALFSLGTRVSIPRWTQNEERAPMRLHSSNAIPWA